MVTSVHTTQERMMPYIYNAWGTTETNHPHLIKNDNDNACTCTQYTSLDGIILSCVVCTDVFFYIGGVI